ncbi:regulator of G-protein signaling 1-like isoform X1 [Primulina huaijiensis]|uniref:regulator of G-protein signaling 1-like isoform X1 n=2 Tax=Primulina huaijiensis TaxID=1492673 RepID=UPI003CC71AE1
MASCAAKGGCPSDYVAIAISFISILVLLVKAAAPYLIHKIPRPKGSGFWLVVIQVFASFNLLLSLVMGLGFLRFRRRHWWISCYVWAVWAEGPLGFGLLMSCRIVQAFQLYNIFVRRRLPPIRSYIFLPLLLLPWTVAASFIQIKKPLNNHCHMGTRWIITILSLHAIYVAVLVGFTAAVRHIEFRFHELKDLWRGILVSACSIGIWTGSYVLTEVHEDVPWLQIFSRFLLLFMTSVLVVVFFTVSMSQPLVSIMSLRRKEHQECKTMGDALGIIPESDVLFQRETSPLADHSEPLDKLLLNRRFRQSFMEFADSCLAGESVHFYEEVQQLDKIPHNDHVRRIYMARHIIDEYISPGSPMEVNISHRSRQEILNTPDLANPNLFDSALNELMHLMKMNLANDYWSSTFFLKLKEEDSMRTVGHDVEPLSGWNFSHRLSSIHCDDDPFQQDHSPKKSGSSHESGK